MKKVIAIIAVLIFMPALAQADVVANMSLGQFLKEDGMSAFDAGSTLALFADANHNGFGDLTRADQWTTDSGDILLGLFSTNDYLGLAGTSANSLTFSYDGLSLGDDLLLAFYDKPFDLLASATGAGAGVSFGTYRSDEIDAGGNSSWNVPEDTSLVDLNFITQSVGGTTPNALGVAQFQTAPEPVSSMLALLGGGVMLWRRRSGREEVVV